MDVATVGEARSSSGRSTVATLALARTNNKQVSPQLGLNHTPSQTAHSSAPAVSATYSLSPLGYLKAIAHSAKHPEATVIGLLVGKIASSEVTIEDAIPLVHHWTSLAMAIEAGLQLAELYAKSQGWVILGLYVANAGLDDTSVPVTLGPVVDALRTNCAQACVLVIDNQALGSDAPALIPHLPVSATAPLKPTPLPSPSFTIASPTIPAVTLQKIRAGETKTIGDFDDHLEDLTVDWLRNASITL